MKPIMLLAIIALTTIVIASSFGLQISPNEAIKIPTDLIGQELYVCPASNSIWTEVSNALRPFIRSITIGFFFIVMLLMFLWGWALYQNLLSDEFKKNSFSNPWKFTKFTFWASVVVALLAFTPNHFRTVHVKGDDRQWVLCDSNSSNVMAVKAEAVYN